MSTSQLITDNVGSTGEILNVYGISLVYFLPQDHSLHVIIRQIQDTVSAEVPDAFTAVDNLHVSIANVDTNHKHSLPQQRIAEVVGAINQLPALDHDIPMRILGLEIDSLARPTILLDFLSDNDRDLFRIRRDTLRQWIPTVDIPATQPDYYMTLSWARRPLTREETAKLKEVCARNQELLRAMVISLDHIAAVYHQDNLLKQHQILATAEQRIPFSRRQKPYVIVVDVGGHSTRIGLLTPSGKLVEPFQYHTKSIQGFRGPLATFQEQFVEQIANHVAKVREQYPDLALQFVGLSLCGPISKDGSVIKLPTVWGNRGANYPITPEIQRRVSGHCVIINDTTAAAMRYANVYKWDERICVINIGSGMGSKIYDRVLRNVLTTHEGFGGELGHITVDFSLNAPICDCGERGHLNAFLSGRGMARWAKQLTADSTMTQRHGSCRSFKSIQSLEDLDMIARVIATDVMQDPSDTFINYIIDRATFMLAMQMHTLEKANGIDRFVLVGDFVASLGTRFLESVKNNFTKAVGTDYFGRTSEQMQGLIELGADDGNDGLLGVGAHVQDLYSRGELAATTEYGVRHFRDLYGNDLFEVATPRCDTYQVTFADGIFDANNETLAKTYCLDKKVVVVIAEYLRPRETEIQAYFAKHKKEGTIDDFRFCFIDAGNLTKRLETVLTIVESAESFGIRRRDLFVAVGGGSLMDMVGLAAAIYRRAASYVRVPMTLTGMVNSARLGGRVHVNYTDSLHAEHKNLLGTFHQPAACLIDRRQISMLSLDQITQGLSEMIKVAVISNSRLFELIETNYRNVGQKSTSAIHSLLDQSIRAGLDQSQKDMEAHRNVLPMFEFNYEIGRIIEESKGFKIHQMEASTMGMALLAALSFVMGKLPRNDLARIVRLLLAIGSPVYDKTVMPEPLLSRIRAMLHSNDAEQYFVLPRSIGEAEYINIGELTEDMFLRALAMLEHYALDGASMPIPSGASLAKGAPKDATSPPNVATKGKVFYKVEHIHGIFDKNNPKLATEYCRGKRVLVVADDYKDNKLAEMQSYFTQFKQKGIIKDFKMVPMNVTSIGKTIEPVKYVIDEAVIAGMTKNDVFVVAGGGTVTDVVGFAAALYDGGTPYIRIPTTLVGIIDAGIGVKVGVNFKEHKNFIGSYYAPMACLNDETFLTTLSKEDMQCGISEAIKMALVKDRRLFELIEQHHQDLQEHVFNGDTEEIIRRSIETMLTELQPNLDEHDLRRLPDFGHEFGHIIEALSKYSIRHGAAVSIGMGISCYLAYLKGIYSRSELKRTLNLLLNVGLPIYDFCCDPVVLWEKMSAEVIAHKGGKLHLVIPLRIGEGGFIDEVQEIDQLILSDAVRGLERYSNWYLAKKALLETGLNKTTIELARKTFADGDYGEPIPLGYLRPSGIVLPIRDRKLRAELMRRTRILGRVIESALAEIDPTLRTQIYYVPDELIHVTLINYSNYRFSELPFELLPEEAIPAAQEILSRYQPIRGRVTGIYLNEHGVMVAQVISDTREIENLRDELMSRLQIRSELRISDQIWITLGRVLTTAKFSPSQVEQINALIDGELLDHKFGEIELRDGKTASGRILELGAAMSSARPEEGKARKNIGIIGASGDLGSQFANYVLAEGHRVLCSVRPQSLDAFPARVNYVGSTARVFLGAVVTVPNVREMIQSADVLYNCAGIVGLGLGQREHARVLAINGFAQGVVASLVHSSGREDQMMVVYPSSQRVHLLMTREDVASWIARATEAFDRQRECLMHSADVEAGLISFSQAFIDNDPLPDGVDVYELSKRLGETFVARVKRHFIARISSVYGPGLWPRGFLQRSIYARIKGVEREESREQRDFIYVQDLNAIVLKYVTERDAPSRTIDVASGTSINLDEAFALIVDNTPHDTGMVRFVAETNTLLQPVSSEARDILLRDFTIFSKGLQNTIDYYRGQFQTNEEDAYLRALRFYQPKTPDPDECQRGLLDEDGAVGGHQSNITLRERIPHVVVLDVGGTNFRVGIMAPSGELIAEPDCCATPGPERYPNENLATLQKRLVESISNAITTAIDQHPTICLKHVGISFGAVVSNEGIVENASVLWHERAQGFDLKHALEQQVPSMEYTIVNDVTAAAWRYKDRGSYCVITVSTGLGNKVFSADSENPYRIVAGKKGLGGEMGHVVVDPAAATRAVKHAQDMASQKQDCFENSILGKYAGNIAANITALHLGNAAKNNDSFALSVLEEVDVPYCPCGNIADLCAYGSGPGVVRTARRMARQRPGEYGTSILAKLANGNPESITAEQIASSAQKADAFVLKLLDEATMHLAQRILQLSADIGLETVIITGGFAVGVGRAYIDALRQNLVNLSHSSGYFTDWDEQRIRSLVALGNADGQDGLIGIGYLVQHLQGHYKAAIKPVREQRLVIMERAIPRCGADEVIVGMRYSGICATDIQIYRGQRIGEPGVLGHECIAQVMEVGSQVSGIKVGDVITINPNNPFDEEDKIGHCSTREGVFQEVYKFSAELLAKGQVLIVGKRFSPEDVLIEPLACVLNAQQMIEEIRGKSVLVIGAGLTGQLHVMVSKLRGAANVFLANSSQARLDWAVGKGIVEPSNAHITGHGFSQWLLQRSTQRGADVVIIAVSRNAGLTVAHEALDYVTDGGVIQLFGGFTGGDRIHLPTGEVVMCADIRRSREKRTVSAGEKTVTFCGSRGAREVDFQEAASVATQGLIDLSRCVTHVISLGALPEVLEQLTHNTRIAEKECIRAVIDFELAGNVVMSSERHAYMQLKSAASNQKNRIPVDNRFRKIGFDGDHSRLDWVHPPAWSEIMKSIDSARQSRPLQDKRTFVFCATGGFAHAIEGSKAALDSKGSNTVHLLRSLDPFALDDVLTSIHDMSQTVCVGISKSGGTIETVQLMNTLREAFDSASLDYRDHFLWLSDVHRERPHELSGEEVIKTSNRKDWSAVTVLPLAFGVRRGLDALFAAPHSLAFFLPLAVLVDDDARLEHNYAEYGRLREEMLNQAFKLVDAAMVNDVPHFAFSMGSDLDGGLGNWILQLVQQSLGSKREDFNPKTLIAPSKTTQTFVPISFNFPDNTPLVVREMLTMHMMQVFVAILAYKKDIAFATHDAVNSYKREMKRFLQTGIPESPSMSMQELLRKVGEQLQDGAKRFVEFICYQHVSEEWRLSFQDEMSRRFPGVISNVFRGSDWNHHSYQAAFRNQDTLFVTITADETVPNILGVSASMIKENALIHKAIAFATNYTLKKKSLDCKLIVE